LSAAADPLFGEAPLASPELALVDSTLAAELRQNLSPVVDAWLRPLARVEPISVASDEDASLQLDSTHDPEEVEPRDAEQLDDPDLPWPALEEDDREGSTLHVPARVEEAPASIGGVPVSDQSSVLDERRGAVRGDEPLLVDDLIITPPEQTPAEEEQTRSHYPVLPAPEPDAEAIDAADAAFRRIRERLTETHEKPSRTRRIRRRFTLASGVVAACAVAALGADLQLRPAQLLSWAPF
jgi:hypothetical protein